MRPLCIVAMPARRTVVNGAAVDALRMVSAPVAGPHEQRPYAEDSMTCSAARFRAPPPAALDQLPIRCVVARPAPARARRPYSSRRGRRLRARLAAGHRSREPRPADRSVVMAHPVRSRHGASRLKRGHRTTIARGFKACTTSQLETECPDRTANASSPRRQFESGA
jgi:hypothetical protein